MKRFAIMLAGIFCLPTFSALAVPLDARLGLRLEFGAGLPASPGYSLALNTAGPRESPVSLLELDLSDRAAFTRIAGVPLVDHSYRSNQDAATTSTHPGSKPWYARQWVWWTAGGVAAMAAVVGSSGDEATGGVTINGGPSACVLSGGNVGPQELPAACVREEDIPDDPDSGFAARFPIADLSVSLDRSAWLDAGTGHMGDLFAR